MVLDYHIDLIPQRRRGCEVLLESVNYDLDKLSPEQTAAIRALYFLDDDRTVEQLVKAGLLE